MPIIHLDDVEKQEFPNGATYQTIVGDDQGTTPVRVGVQVSPPGYSTGAHSHPYMEVVTILEGACEAWIGKPDEVTELSAGATMVFPPDTPHGFTVIGTAPLKTYGVHASSTRIVDR